MAINRYKNVDIIKREGLKEIYGGDWEEELFEDLPKKWPDEYYTWDYKPHKHIMPNGETMVEFQTRVINEIDYIIRSCKKKNICIVTHGTVIKILLGYFKKLELKDTVSIKWCDNTALTIVEYCNNDYNVIIEGDAEHLAVEDSTLLNQSWWKEYLDRMEKD